MDRPNLVFGGDVHVVWEKFCRYFDVEPRIVPLAGAQVHDRPRGRGAPPRREHDRRGRRARYHVHRAHGRHRGINTLLGAIEEDKGLHVPLHVDGASGGFVWPFLYPDSEWDFRLNHVRSINVSGHKYGLVYPGIGWLIFRESSDLSEDLVFYENYLGKTDATFTLNFSTGSAMVLAQYYNLIRFGREGYTYIMEMMQKNAGALAEQLKAIGPFELIGEDEERLPLVAFKLAEPRSYDEFDIAWQLSRRARLDGARVHPSSGRPPREGDARAGQGDAEPGDGGHPRPATSRRPVGRSTRRAATHDPSASRSRRDGILISKLAA